MPVTHPELLMASLMLIGSKEIGEKLGLKPRANKMGAIGSEPLIMLEGPIPATKKKALRKANMNVGDIDIFEVNEALQSFPCAWII
jgi:acetyl-CoA C-acetyltransferase